MPDNHVSHGGGVYFLPRPWQHRTMNKNRLIKPRALTPDVQREIIRGLTVGSYLGPALASAGISRDTFEYWQIKVDRGDEDAGEFVDFYRTVACVTAKAELKALESVMDGKMGWQGPAWWLSRRFPKRWSEKARAAVVQPTLDPTAPSDEDGNTP